MKTITLGTDGPRIGRIGLGLMGMSAFYTGASLDDAGSIRT
ncbi:MAG: aldo/keto reductase, partial [Rhodoglobus sp.]